MNRRLLTAIVTTVLCLTTFMLVIVRDRLVAAQGVETLTQPTMAPLVKPAVSSPGLASNACAVQPDKGSVKMRQKAMLERRARLLSSGSVSLSRFRQELDVASQSAEGGAKATTDYVPREEMALIDPTNYGDRFLNDINGNPANLEPLVVLHETVGSASSAINLFKAFHLNDDDQVSYHTLVKRNGTVVYLVPPDKRAFGAGNSSFVGVNGLEAVRTSSALSASVNNFAYHISLETPYDGNHNGYTHSGYTQAQYQSLAWLVANTGVAEGRITTHKGVDRSRSRIDPRSFSDKTFFALLRAQPKTTTIAIRCTDPSLLPTQP
ncbi:peptidoglycan recognition protein family protein [Stenomitos frigidus]|uniref:N-acetylmuramoyl-L-alanine amidase n=1 Tax=Stenomitos frigidus ULC18 TaxID=2107698 RepID=A0A2T1E523_9CYAN|nr:peptidoglycan recognition family protein [Stenomitos frigidus]PSB27839.1 N-acetylmuramoyl-L-alanine amidase [Stenomitos frigidus ULC18]